MLAEAEVAEMWQQSHTWAAQHPNSLQQTGAALNTIRKHPKGNEDE